MSQHKNHCLLHKLTHIPIDNICLLLSILYPRHCYHSLLLLLLYNGYPKLFQLHYAQIPENYYGIARSQYTSGPALFRLQFNCIRYYAYATSDEYIRHPRRI